MGKRAAPKSEPKAKAKAKTAPRASSSKAQSMTEDELGEYRQLHSKLTYRSKVGVAGADEALQQLKSNRQLVMDKFRGDKSMSWVPSSLTVYILRCTFVECFWKRTNVIVIVYFNNFNIFASSEAWFIRWTIPLSMLWPRSLSGSIPFRS